MKTISSRFLKGILLATVPFLLPSQALADTYQVVYRMTLPWEGVHPPRFSDLEQKGVERHAEIAAVQECTRQGGSNCVAITASILRCNQREYIDGDFKVSCYAESTATSRL